MTTNSSLYQTAVAQLKADLDALLLQTTHVRAAIKAMSTLTEPGTGKTKHPRAKGPASTADVPEELAQLTTPERLRLILETNPQRRWTANELASAAHVASINSVRTSLARMVDRSMAVLRDDGKWTAVPTPSGAV